MRLTSLDVNNVRNIEHVQISPAPGFNLFFGKNGAGKTSLLEAIAILSTGRSFRSGKVGTVIRSSQDQLTISAEVRTVLELASNRIGIQRGLKETVVRINGENVNRISALAKALPCVTVSTSNHELIEGGSAGRRAFLDWMLFHVEPTAHEWFQRYRHALVQRNAALKSNSRDELIRMWHPELIETGQKIDAGRKQLLEIFKNKIGQVLLEWPGDLSPDFHYRTGWPEGISLSDGLSRLDQCRRRGVTSVGPHRADIVVKSGQQESRYVLSRGQQKLLAAQMRLLQIEIYQENQKQAPVVLFDDLPSELDDSARLAIFNYLQKKNAQVFITSVDDVSANLQYDCELFHVEQGKVEKVIY